uniref:Uncharacterized protein n=1 Tax=Anopheles atroparvus TaxID=41427 RepID=A0A182JAA0_ANOAO
MKESLSLHGKKIVMSNVASGGEATLADKKLIPISHQCPPKNPLQPIENTNTTSSSSIAAEPKMLSVVAEESERAAAGGGGAGGGTNTGGTLPPAGSTEARVGSTS